MNWKATFPKTDRFFETKNGILYCGNAKEVLKRFPDEIIDLTITSPPYDNLRFYGAKKQGGDLEDLWNFEVFKEVAQQLYRITKKGGVVVWVVGDATIRGSETGNSFRQALYFKDECGFNLHDTMIYAKTNPIPLNHNRYEQCFEYMFVLSKGKPKTFNPIRIPCKYAGRERKSTYRHTPEGILEPQNTNGKVKDTKIKCNIWYYTIGYKKSAKDDVAFKHPAIFPEQLAYDHIISWSNAGDIVLDPLAGSGTTLKMAELLNRKWIGIEINEEYCEIAKRRIAEVSNRLF